jgi:hypothetical protein
MPAAEDNNTKRCFPQYWTPEGATEPVLDWFHKYVVVQATEEDRTGGQLNTITLYEQVGTPAWHYDDDDGLVPTKYKTWSQWRGYATVRVRQGASGGPQSLSETLFFRGMDDDKLKSGGRRDVKVTDSQGGVVEDHWRLQGFAREGLLFNGVGGELVWVQRDAKPCPSGPSS